MVARTSRMPLLIRLSKDASDQGIEDRQRRCTIHAKAIHKERWSSNDGELSSILPMSLNNSHQFLRKDTLIENVSGSDACGICYYLPPASVLRNLLIRKRLAVISIEDAQRRSTLRTECHIEFRTANRLHIMLDDNR